MVQVAYLIFWGPLFLVTLLNWGWEWKDAKKSMWHEVGGATEDSSPRPPGVPPRGVRPLLREPAAVRGAAQGLQESHARHHLLRLLSVQR